MFFAYAAGMRSAQLGRQVGACVTSREGDDVLSVGCNDVPKVGGGLYWPGPADRRDHILKYDTNDAEIADISRKIYEKVKPFVESQKGLPVPSALFKDALDITELAERFMLRWTLSSSVRIGVSLL